MRVAVMGTALLLGACGGTAAPENKTDANATQASSPAPAVAPDCSGKPDFAPVEAGATITTCTQGSALGKVSGTILYTVEAAPAAVLAAAKAHATGAGLKINIDNDMTVSASEGQRTLMVMAMPQGSGSTVTVNWGRAP
jgi:hypothetical protein